MAQERLSIRKIREILRLRFAAGLSPRQVAASVGNALSTIQECLRRPCPISPGWTSVSDAVILQLRMPGDAIHERRDPAGSAGGQR